MIMLVERAGGSHAIGGVEYATAAGDLYVIAPGAAYDGRKLGSTRGWLLSFMPDALMPSMPAAPGSVPLPGDARWFARGAPATWSVVPIEDRPRFSLRFAEVAVEIRGRRLGYQEAIRGHLALLLVDIARFTGSVAELPRATADDAIQKMIEVIDARYGSDLSVADVARAVATSPGHLSRMAKRVTGASVRQWIEERRMREARRLLLETDQAIELIARAVGYTDPKYFRRRFRNAHGMPPQRWRELNR